MVTNNNKENLRNALKVTPPWEGQGGGRFFTLEEFTYSITA